jgi:YD repeat-containing protein
VACQKYVDLHAQENADRRFPTSQGYTSAGYRNVVTDGYGCGFTLYGVHPIYGEQTAAGGAGNEAWENQCPLPDPFKSAGEQCSTSGGNPINFATGNKYQAEHDYRSADGTLDFSRYYNSQTEDPPGISPYLSALGKNWRSTYDRAIRVNATDETAYVYRPDGKTLPFRLSGSSYSPDADITDHLEKLTPSGSFAGWRYTIDATGEVENYDVAGRLQSITSRAGAVTTLAYDGSGRLDHVTNAFGASLSFGYDTSSRLSSLTDPAGQAFTYGYGLNPGKNVESVTFPGGATRSYVYAEYANVAASHLPNALTGIIDEASTRYATFRYNASLQATSTEHAGTVEKYQVQYSANPSSNSVSFTDPLGQSRTLSLSTVQGMRRVTAANVPATLACAKGKASGFDANANAVSKTDFNDNKTCYAYDTTRNLETIRVEGFAPGVSCPANLASYTPTTGTRQRKISTQWHATFRLPTQIDEAGKRTTFTHDANGNVFTRTVLDTTTSESRTWTYTYNSVGQVLTADGPRTDVSDVTTYTYYSCTTGYECGQLLRSRTLSATSRPTTPTTPTASRSRSPTRTAW